MSLATRQSSTAFRRFMLRSVEKRVKGCNNSKRPVNNFTNEYMNLLPLHANYILCYARIQFIEIGIYVNSQLGDL